MEGQVFMARHKHMNIKIRQGLLKTIACGVAASTLFGGFAWAADGGGGSTGGNTGSGNYTSRLVWATNDNFGPANDGTVTSVLTGQLGGTIYGGAASHVHQATSAALTECNNNYAARHQVLTAASSRWVRLSPVITRLPAQPETSTRMPG